MNHFNSYEDGVDWLFSRFADYQNNGPKAYKPGLDRVYLLLEILQINAQKIPSIHIAGTNGKGSTAAFCASLLKENGYKVGLFTSPHIFDFTERIRVNGIAIAQSAVLKFCNEVQSIKLNFEPSFFELSLALGLIYFQDQKCDYIVIETGLGGKLDATNILRPEISIITNIGLDHKEFLGNSLAEIAEQKAGIIKSHIPVIIGEKHIETQEIFKKTASSLNAPLVFCDDIDIAFDSFQLQGYQIRNYKTAFIALEKIGFKFNVDQQKNALKNLKRNTGFFGRLELWKENPRILIDVSHNLEGILATLPLVREQCKGQLFIIYGAAQDKNAEQILALLPSEAQVAACVFSNPRSRQFLDWKNLGVETIYQKLDIAISQIEKQMDPNDLLWITGSFYLISDLPSKK